MEALTYINDSKWKITIYQEIYEQQKINVIESTYKDFFISIDVTFEQKILLEPEFSHNSLLILKSVIPLYVNQITGFKNTFFSIFI